MRNNGGGALEDARLMSGLFLGKGPIVQVKDHTQKVEVLEMLPMIMFRNSLVRRYGVVTDPIPVEKL